MIPGIIAHLWQSTLFGGAAWLITLALRTNRAQVRYGVWFTASAKFLVPFSLLVGLGALVPHRSTAPASRSEWVAALQEFSQPLLTPTIPAQPALVTGVTKRAYLESTVVVLWACGFAAVAICWLLRWRRVHALRKSARIITFPTAQVPVPVMSAPGVMEPGVVGILRPMLLLPEGIAERLNPLQLDAILTHELCHVRRRDNLTASIHMAVQAIFWFNPMTWWIGARLLDERERACDEDVLRHGYRPDLYAESILMICKSYLASPLACVAGVTGADLKRRIVRIMTQHSAGKLSFGKKLLLMAVCVTAVVGPVVFGARYAELMAQQTTSEDWQRAAGGQIAFDVASVRLKPGPLEPSNFRLSPDDAYTATGGLLYADYPLATYIEFAYKIWPTREQWLATYAHLPTWVRTDNYEIHARTAQENPTKDQMRLMMQSLLKERFGLVVHYETQDTPVLDMSLVKLGVLGPNLHRHEDGPACDVMGTAAGAELEGTDIFPAKCGGVEAVRRPNQMILMGGRDTTLEMIGKSFSIGRLGRPVVDETGLTGKYDFTLSWAPEPGTFGTEPGAASQDAPASDPQGPTFLEAAKDQLGLTLKPERAPLKVLVIDHVERPSEN